MQKNNKIGIVGAGNIVEKVHLPVLTSINNISIVWICDIDLNKAENLSKQYKIPQYYSKIEDCPSVDIVLIAIPVGYRKLTWEWIFKNKAHVLCEKPLTSSFEEHLDIIDRSKQLGIEINICYMRRYYDSMFIIKNLLASKLLGNLIEVFANDGNRSHNTGRGKDWYQLNIEAAGGGILIEKGVHMIDQVFSLLPFDSFQIHEVKYQSIDHLEYDIRVRASLNIGNDNIKFNVWNSRSEDLANGIYFYFEKGIISIPLEPSGTIKILNHQNEVVLSSNSSGLGATTSNQAFAKVWTEFLTQLNTKNKSLTDIENTKATTEFIVKTYHHLK